MICCNRVASKFFQTQEKLRQSCSAIKKKITTFFLQASGVCTERLKLLVIWTNHIIVIRVYYKYEYANA